MLLCSLTFPSAIHSIRTDPGDHALYAGSGDGRIFETSLVGEVTSGEGSGEQHEAGYYTMEGHEGAVACLAMTTDANQLVSGGLHGSTYSMSNPALVALQPAAAGHAVLHQRHVAIMLLVDS